ncbi:MAG: RNA polymerase Rpb4 family protein [Candidatus Korarchaeota archaeon]|nr:RNA polymerase Rpb4 family protein [Candidatus Korarchaeota archaeon]
MAVGVVRVEELVETRVLTIPEALELMKRRVEEAEATDLQNRTLEYLELFAKCGAREAAELHGKLVEKGLSPEAAAMVVNVAPRSRDELRTLLYGENLGLEAGELDEILGLIEEHCGGGK